MINHFKTFRPIQQFFIVFFFLGGLVTLASIRHLTVGLLWGIGVTLTVFYKRKKCFLSALWGILKHPIFLILIALLAWSVSSSIWSINPWQSLRASLSQIATLFLVTTLFTHLQSLTERSFSWTIQVLISLFSLASFLLLIQLPPFFQTFKVLLGYQWSTLKPNVALVLIFSIALGAYWNLKYDNKKMALLWISLSLFLAYQTAYQTGFFGLIFGGVAALLAYRFSYFIPMASAYISAFLCLSLPALFQYFIPMMDLKGLWFTSGMTSLAHRFYIWEFITERIWEKSLFGWGAASSRGFPTGGLKVFAGDCLFPSHPHNHIMQIWLELGGIGAVMLAVLNFMLFRSIAKLKSRLATAWAMLFSITCFVILGFSHSIWHKWWITWLGAVAVLMVVIIKTPSKKQSDP